MKAVLKLEELGMWVGCIILLYAINVEWWLYVLMFLGPDVSMLGYLINNRVGAWSYNLFHHKGVAVIILVAGAIISNNNLFSNWAWLFPIGLVLLGHSSMDRFFGYGLKYENGFKFTHLGEIGKKPL